MDEIVDEVLEAAAEHEAALRAVMTTAARLQTLCKKYQRPKSMAKGDWGNVQYLRKLHPALRRADTVADMQREAHAAVAEVLAQRRKIDDKVAALQQLELSRVIGNLQPKRENKAIDSLTSKLERESNRLDAVGNAITYIPLPKDQCPFDMLPDELLTIILGMARRTRWVNDRDSADSDPLDYRYRLVCHRWRNIIKHNLRNAYADIRWRLSLDCDVERPTRDLPAGVLLNGTYIVSPGKWLQNVLCADGPRYVRTKGKQTYYCGHLLPIERAARACIADGCFVTVVPQAHTDTVTLWTIGARRPAAAWSLPVEGVAAIALFDDGTVVVGSPLEVVAYRDGAVAWRSKPIDRKVHMALALAVDRKRGRILATNDLRYWRVYDKATGKVVLAGGQPDPNDPMPTHNKKQSECNGVAINERTGTMFWLGTGKVIWMRLPSKNSKIVYVEREIKTVTVAPNDQLYLSDGKSRFWTL